mgnify:CR=1 FL=1
MVHQQQQFDIRKHLKDAKKDRDLCNYNNSLAPHSSDWLRATPAASCRMDKQTFRTALCYKFNIPIHKEVSRCTMCKKPNVMDEMGDHALVCTFGGEKTKRHNAVVDIIYASVKRYRPLMDREESKHLLADSTGKKPADLLIPDWSQGKRAALDITVIAPMQQKFKTKLKSPKNVGCVAQAGVRGKNDKYARLCADVGIMFLPFALDATGGFPPEAEQFIHDLYILSGGVSNTSLNFRKALLYSQIAIEIQKWLVHLISRRIIPHIEHNFHGVLDLGLDAQW